MALGAVLTAVTIVVWLRGKPRSESGLGPPRPSDPVASNWDAEIRWLMETGVDRRQKVELLLKRLASASDSEKPAFLDMLASLRPIEAVESLLNLLENTRDPVVAERILQALRAATMVTSSEQKVNLDDRALTASLEAIQAVFRDELAHPEHDAVRFRAAVAGIADMFPGEEAERMFHSMLAARDASSETFPISEAEILGRWLEFKVGDVERRNFAEISGFIREHPSAVVDERVKARLVALLDVTSLRADESAGVVRVLELLEPVDAPDDSFLRWLRTKERVTGMREPLANLWSAATPLRKAALLLYGGYDLPRELPADRLEALKRELQSAADGMPASEERDFLREAAEELP